MKPINRLVVGISLAILVVAPISNAQVIEEITVTARKKSENLQDVPISVNVITSQMMVVWASKTYKTLPNLIRLWFLTKVLRPMTLGLWCVA